MKQCCVKTGHPFEEQECDVFNFAKKEKIDLKGLNKAIEYGGNYYCPFHLPKNSQKNSWTKDEQFHFNSLVIKFIEKGFGNFENVVFPFRIKFDNLKIKQQINFSYAKFLNIPSFDGAEFLSGCIFTGTVFEARGWFKNATFYHIALFTYAEFRSDLMFNRATFPGDALFFGCVFNDSAYFTDVNFNSLSNFFKCKINKDINFENSIFRKGAIFNSDSMDSIGFTNFSGAEFFKTASFKNRKFTSGANFEVKAFHEAPEFHGSKIHQNTSFTSIDNFHDTSCGKAARSYRTLKLAMAEQRAFEEEGMFYALEQKSRRNSSKTKPLDKFISTAYEEISFYGQDYLRPLALWVALFFFFLIAYGSIAQQTFGQTLNSLDLISFSLQQGILPFSAWRTGGLDQFTGISLVGNFWLKILSIIQGLTSITLIALSLLALRWRFKRQ